MAIASTRPWFFSTILICSARSDSLPGPSHTTSTPELLPRRKRAGLNRLPELMRHPLRDDRDPIGTFSGLVLATAPERDEYGERYGQGRQELHGGERYPLRRMGATRIDSHQHFWSYDPVDHAWMVDGMEALRRDFDPTELLPELEAFRMDGCVAVQARQSLAETHGLLELAPQALIRTRRRRVGGSRRPGH